MDRKKHIEEIRSPQSSKAKLEPVDTTRLRRTKKILRSSKNLYQIIMNSTSFGFSVIDLNHKIVMVNDMLGRYFRKPASKLVGRECFREFGKRDFVCPHCPGKQAMATGKPAEFKTEEVCKDGSYFSANIQAFPTIGPDGKATGFIEIVEDISERRKKEEAIQANEAQLSNVMKIAKLGYWEYDVAKDLFTFNDHFYRVFRTTAKQVGGYTMSPARYAQLFLHPDDSKSFNQEIQRAIDTTDPHYSRQLEHRIIYADGETGYITVRYSIVKDKRGRTIKAYGANQDITERKRIEQALRESRDYLVRLTNSMWEAVFSVKMPERIIEWANDSFRLIGYEPEECIGKTTEFLYQNTKEFLSFGKKMEKTIAAGKDILHTEQLLKRKNGRIFPAEITATIFQEKGEVVRITGIVRDITERRRAEEKLRDSENLLHQVLDATPNPIFAKDKDGR